MNRLHRAAGAIACAVLLLSTASAQMKDQERGTIDASGQSVTFLDRYGSGTLTFEVNIGGSPSAMSVTFQGCMRGGTCTTLTPVSGSNPYTGTTSGVVTVTGGYDYYTATATWTGTAVVTINKVGIQAKTAVGGGGGGDVTLNGVQTLTNKTLGSTTPAELGYVHGVTSAIQTQLDSKALPNATDIRSYGASTAASDNTTAWNTAMTAACLNGTLIIPMGTYKFTSSLEVPCSRLNIVGAGKESTILWITADSTDGLRINSGTTFNGPYSVKNLSIVGPPGPTIPLATYVTPGTGIGLNLNYMYDNEVEDVKIYGFSGPGLNTWQTTNTKLDTLTVRNNGGDGWTAGQQTDATVLVNSNFYRNSGLGIHEGTGTGTPLAGSANFSNTITFAGGNLVSTNKLGAIVLEGNGTRGVSFHGLYTEFNGDSTTNTCIIRIGSTDGTKVPEPITIEAWYAHSDTTYATDALCNYSGTTVALRDSLFDTIGGNLVHNFNKNFDLTWSGNVWSPAPSAVFKAADGTTTMPSPGQRGFMRIPYSSNASNTLAQWSDSTALLLRFLKKDGTFGCGIGANGSLQCGSVWDSQTGPGNLAEMLNYNSGSSTASHLAQRIETQMQGSGTLAHTSCDATTGYTGTCVYIRSKLANIQRWGNGAGTDSGVAHQTGFTFLTMSDTVEAVTFSSTPTFSVSAGNHRIVLTGNVTSSTLAAGLDGQHTCFNIVQDATGSRTFAWPANVLGGMTVGATASKRNHQCFVYYTADSAWLAESAGVTNQ